MSALSQAFPPTPGFTEKDLSDQDGKVFVVTGASSGVGFELASLLYGKGGKVYIAARSQEKISRAIESIKEAVSSKTGEIEPLVLDLADLSSIKASANDFLSKEERLDVLVHNAGVMTPPANSKTSLGHDLEMGTNCLGPFLFNHFLEDIIRRTALKQDSKPNSVRIVWLSSMIAASTPQGGITFDEAAGQPKVLKDPMMNYMQSKVGNLFMASQTAKRLGEDGVISVSVHPGLMRTELQRHSSKLMGVMMGILFKSPRYGAYTELFGGFSPAIDQRLNGSFIIPWGRIGPIPEHIKRGLATKKEGGTGLAQRFWSWCERETKAYM